MQMGREADRVAASTLVDAQRTNGFDKSNTASSMRIA